MNREQIENIINKRIQDGIDLNKPFARYYAPRDNPLYHLVKSHNFYPDLMIRILKRGADPDCSNLIFRPLVIACSDKHPGKVNILLKYGANINKKNSWDDTPLHAFFDEIPREKDIPLLKKLLQAKANVNALDHNFATPLHKAVGWYFHRGCYRGYQNDIDSTCNKEVVLTSIKLLLAHDARVTIKNRNSHTPIDIADLNNQEELAAYLERHCIVKILQQCGLMKDIAQYIADLCYKNNEIL